MASDRHAATTSPEEEALFLDIPLETPLFGHRKPTSLVGSVLYCILLAGYAILDAASPWIFHPGQDFLSSALCSCSVALLIVTGIFQQYLVYQVQKIRLQGYYVFSQKLKNIVRLPFATTAYATAAILLVMVWKPLISLLAISVLLRIIMLVEAVFAAFFMSVYIGYIHRYNSLDSQPDVLKSLYSPLQPSTSSEGLRAQKSSYLHRTNLMAANIEAFVELKVVIICLCIFDGLHVEGRHYLKYGDGGGLADQQMALLQYQQENLHLLCEEILRLQECLSKYERASDGSGPQVDLAHLLATRDQELRTLSTEMNQLKSELTLAQSLIAERDSELQLIRNTNNQYLEENERLRAILAEWSTRAAKLERAFEAERISNLELQKKISTFRYQKHVHGDAQQT